MRLVRQKRAPPVVFLLDVDCSRHGPQITVAVRAQMSCLVWLRFYGVLGGGDGMDGYSAMAEGLLFSIRDEKRGSISFQWASHNSEFADDPNGVTATTCVIYLCELITPGCGDRRRPQRV
jgi:hypothetical protein